MEAITNKDGSPLYPGFAEFKLADSPSEESWGNFGDRHKDWVLLAILPGDRSASSQRTSDGYCRSCSSPSYGQKPDETGVLSDVRFLFGRKEGSVIDRLRQQLEFANQQSSNRSIEMHDLKEQLKEVTKDADEKSELVREKDEHIKSLIADHEPMKKTIEEMASDLNRLRRHFGSKAVADALADEEGS